MKILLIEDDQKISNFITKGLREELMSVDQAYDGEEGLYLGTVNHYDVMIIDWMLPKLSGPDIIKHMRLKRVTTPILMLTARGDIDDRVEGLQSGADDYLSKPFAFSELIARIRALHRRSGYDERIIFSVDTLTFDPLKRDVRRDGRVIDLSNKEFALMEFLLRNKGRMVTNTMILENIWDMQEQVESNVVSVTVYNLRKKIDQGSDKKLIKTVRGSGYRLEDV